MWKILLVTAIITSLSLTSSAQPPAVKKGSTPLLCMPLDDLLKIIKESGEVPIFIGEDDFVSNTSNKNLNIMVTFNDKKKDYSVFFIVKNPEAGCVISSGVGSIILGKTI